jgi:hypothetical protein
VVALVVAVTVWAPWRQPGPVLERGGGASLQPGGAEIVGGNLALSWAPHPGATAYVVVIYGPDFSELLRMPPVQQTAAVIPLTDLPEEPRLAWRVLALENGDVVATSEPGYISVP